MAGETIALGAAPTPQFYGPDFNALANAQRTAVYVQQAQQQVQAENALRALYSDPSNYDPKTQNPTPEAYNRLFQVSPQAGMLLQKNQLAMDQQRTRQQFERGQIAKEYREQSGEIATQALAAYDEASKSMPPEAALRAGQKVYTDLFNEWKTSLPPEIAAQASPTFDPMRARGTKMALEREKDALDVQEKQQKLQQDGYTLTDQVRNGVAEKIWVNPDPKKPPKTLDGRPIAEGNVTGVVPTTRGQEPEPWVVDVPDGQGGSKQETVKINPKGGWLNFENNEPVTGATNPRKVGASAAGGALLSKEAADQVADQYQAGDKSAVQGLGWGAVGSANRAAVREALVKRGVTGADLAAAIAEFGGTQAAERALGTRQANLGIALNEAKAFIPMGIAASGKVDRTQFPNLNSVILAFDKGTGNEEVVRLAVATNAISNAYAQVAARGGVSTDAARATAREILNDAYSKGQYATAADQMMKEIEQAQTAPTAVRGELRQGITGKAPGAGTDQRTDKTSAEAPIQGPKLESIKKEGGYYAPSTEAEYDAIPSGPYWHDGKILRKP